MIVLLRVNIKEICWKIPSRGSFQAQLQWGTPSWRLVEHELNILPRGTARENKLSMTWKWLIPQTEVQPSNDWGKTYDCGQDRFLRGSWELLTSPDSANLIPKRNREVVFCPRRKCFDSQQKIRNYRWTQTFYLIKDHKSILNESVPSWLFQMKLTKPFADCKKLANIIGREGNALLNGNDPEKIIDRAVCLLRMSCC